MGETNGDVRVLLADDHAAYREGLREVLDAAGFLVIADAPDGLKAVELAGELEPDVVIIDLHMPRMDGVAATRELVKLRNSPIVLVLTAWATSSDVVGAIAAGASGYLLKGASHDEVVESLRATLAGHSPVSPAAAAAVLDRVRLAESDYEKPYELPPLKERELDVLRLVALGRDNQEIAEELFLSESSVKKYVVSVCDKLGVRTRVQAAVLAVRAGVV